RERVDGHGSHRRGRHGGRSRARRTRAACGRELRHLADRGERARRLRRATRRLRVLGLFDRVFVARTVVESDRLLERRLADELDHSLIVVRQVAVRIETVVDENLPTLAVIAALLRAVEAVLDAARSEADLLLR